MLPSKTLADSLRELKVKLEAGEVEVGDGAEIVAFLKDTIYRLDMLGSIPLRHPDDIAVDAFAQKMKHKMKVGREQKGRSGWDDPDQCSPGFLRVILYEHLDKGDPVDVANICMMLDHHHSHTIKKSPLEKTNLGG